MILTAVIHVRHKEHACTISHLIRHCKHNYVSVYWFNYIKIPAMTTVQFSLATVRYKRFTFRKCAHNWSLTKTTVYFM